MDNGNSSKFKSKEWACLVLGGITGILLIEWGLGKLFSISSKGLVEIIYLICVSICGAKGHKFTKDLIESFRRAPIKDEYYVFLIFLEGLLSPIVLIATALVTGVITLVLILPGLFLFDVANFYLDKEFKLEDEGLLGYKLKDAFGEKFYGSLLVNKKPPSIKVTDICLLSQVRFIKRTLKRMGYKVLRWERAIKGQD